CIIVHRHTLRFANAGGSVPSFAAISQPSAPMVLTGGEGSTPVFRESSTTPDVSAPPTSPEAGLLGAKTNQETPAPGDTGASYIQESPRTGRVLVLQTGTAARDSPGRPSAGA